MWSSLVVASCCSISSGHAGFFAIIVFSFPVLYSFLSRFAGQLGLAAICPCQWRFLACFLSSLVFVVVL